MGLKDVDALYGEGYQQGSIAPEALLAWERISDVLIAHFPFPDWCDVGCGGGGLVLTLQAKGKRAWGIEGAEAAIGKLPVPITLHDLREPFRVIKPVDVVTCFDVAEHVGAAETLVQTIAALAKWWVVFGAAPPGQDGVGHIDLREPEEWTRLFLGEGFGLDAELTETVRREIREQEGANFLWWVEKNLQVYARQ